MPYIGNQHNVGDHVNNFKVLDDISSYTATFNGSATSVVSTSNDTIRIPVHRFIQGQRVTYNNGGGSNIGGLTSGTAYYVSFDSSNTIKLATSLSNANSNTVINLSSVGGGTSHTLNAAFDGINTKFKVTYASGKAARFNNATQLNVAINNVIQRPNLSAASFTEGFAIEDSHKIVFKDAPTASDIFWGSIIANTIENFDLRDNEIDNFTGNGSTTEFTLSTVPANNESVIVTIDGVLQHPSDSATTRAYTLIDSIIQFSSAPALNAEIQVRHIGFAGATTNDVSGFYGRTGNVALTANDHITTGDLTSRNVNISGILTASSASFGGNVSIGGTLSYEDVTNIDSVGLITARDGIFLPNNKHISLGTGNDMRIYSAAGGLNNSFLKKTGTGPLNFDFQGDFLVRNTAGSMRAKFTGPLGAVELYHSSQKKFETTSSGVSITQDLDVDGHTNLDNVSVAGVTTFAGAITAPDVLTAGALLHEGDTNTLVHFSAEDTIELKTHGYSRLSVTNNGVALTGGYLNSNGYRIILGDSSGANDDRLVLGNTNDLQLYHDASDSYIQNATGVLKILGNDIQLGEGNDTVGIGTDNALARLDVYKGTSATDVDIFAVRSKTGAFHIQCSDTDAANPEWRLRTYYNEPIVFSPGNVEKVRITPDGNLGLGTASPVARLHVHNAGTGSGDHAYAYFTTGDTGSDASSGLTIGVAANQVASVNYREAGTLSLNTSASPRITIQSGGDVGIGTISPATILHTYSEGNAHVVLHESAGGYDSRLRIKAPPNRYSQLEFADDDADAGEIRYFHTDNYMSFHVNNNVERFRIDSSGRIGIGINNPGDYQSSSNNLVLGKENDTGGMTIRSGTSNGGYIRFADGTSGNQAYRGSILYSHSLDSLLFATDSTEKLRITSSGNVGINSTTPSATLEIHDIGSTGPCVLLRGATSTEGDVTVPDGESFNFGHWNYASSTFTERLRINSSGRVLVNKTSTSLSHKLQVESADDANAIAIIGRSADDIGEFSFYENDGSTKLGEIQYRQDHVNIRHRVGDIRFATAGATEKVRIDSDGRLLVNTTGATISSAELFEVKSTSTGFSHFRNNSSVYAPIYIDNEASNSGATPVPIITITDGGGNRAGLLLNNSSRFDITGQGSVSLSTGGTVGNATQRLRISSSGVLHLNSVAGGQAVIAFGDPDGNSVQEQNRIGGDTILVNDESISSAISLPRNGCFAVITAYSDTNGNYPQPNTSCMVYIDCGPSRNIRLCDFGSNVGYDVSTKNAYTSNVSDCDNGKLTVMAGDTQGTFRLVNRESNNNYYYQITFL